MIIDAKPIDADAPRGHPVACRFGWHAWERQRWHDPPDDPKQFIYYASHHDIDVCVCCHKTRRGK